MKKLLLYCLRPSLVRRITVVMLMAFVVLWVVLMAYLYYRVNTRDINDESRGKWAVQLSTLVGRYPDEASMRVAAEVISDRVNNLNRQNTGLAAFVMQVERKDGSLLYRSPQAHGSALTIGPAKVGTVMLNKVPYRAYRAEFGRISLTLGEPIPELSWMIARMSEDLTIFVIIALPLVLLPLWFAVAQGLRPLRRLSASIASRGPDDLRPLDTGTSYVELTPLTSALERLLAQLRAKMEREHAFVADAAHELRTPMAVIAAQAHVLVKAEGAQQRLDAEHKLDHAIGRASHLIGQLLELAHVDSDDQRHLDVRDVAELTRHELALVAPSAMARKLDLSLDAPDVLMHPVEAHAFQSILQNLVVNAIRYVQEGGAVAVGLGARDGVLTLTVTDDGPGIPEAQRDLVFERFYRGQAHEAHGSGLGLAIVRQACARLGGSVALLDGPGGAGCAFVVTLPSIPA
ncbi:MAG: ATP-binding protein [Pseudomonadota bacterium]